MKLLLFCLKCHKWNLGDGWKKRKAKDFNKQIDDEVSIFWVKKETCPKCKRKEKNDTVPELRKEEIAGALADDYYLGT